MALRDVSEAQDANRKRGRLSAQRALGGYTSASNATALWFVAAPWQAFRPFLISIFGILVLASCGAAGITMPCEADHRCLRYAITVDIPILDPHVSALPEAGMIFRQLYDTLIYRDGESRKFIPGLASDWQVSRDGIVYTFHLRQDVAFHDGSPFTAESVARNIERIFHPESGSSLARELFGPLQQFEILDEYTIRLRLFEPYAALLDGLAQPYLGIASPAALERYDRLRYQYHQSGTGPFMLEDYLPGERIVLSRYRGYSVDPAIYEPLTGEEIERIEISIIGESGADLVSLLGRTQDVIDDVSPKAAQLLSGNSRAMLLPTQIPGQSVQFVFNTNRQHLDDRAVRLSLLLATNRIAIIDRVFFNTSPLAWMPLSESTGFAHTGFIGEYEFDLAQAQAALSAAGYADTDGDGLLDRDGVPLALTMMVPPWGQLPEVAALLKEQWRQIGVELVTEPVAGESQLRALIHSREFDLLPVTNYGIDPGILGRIFLDRSPYSYALAQHAVLNDMLASAARQQDPAQRRTQYYEIQSLLMKEALLLPIREVARLRAVSADVAGLRYDAYGLYPLLSNVAVTAS